MSVCRRHVSCSLRGLEGRYIDTHSASSFVFLLPYTPSRSLAFADSDDLDTAIDAMHAIADEIVVTLGADGAIIVKAFHPRAQYIPCFTIVKII